MARQSLVSVGLFAALTAVSGIGRHCSCRRSGAHRPRKRTARRRRRTRHPVRRTASPTCRDIGRTPRYAAAAAEERHEGVLHAGGTGRDGRRGSTGGRTGHRRGARDLHYDNEQFGIDKGQATYAQNLRTSLIVDPPDGRIPPQIPEAVKRNAAIAEARKLRGGQFDKVQNMGYDDRCIVMIGTAPPMLDPGYLSTFQIIQSPGYVTILTERLHDARVVPMDGRPFPPSNVRSWKGVSRGHWEGNTLVVETRNSNGRIQEAAVGPIGNGSFEGATENIRVIERFTRVDAATIELSIHNRRREDMGTTLERRTAVREDGATRAVLRACLPRGESCAHEHDERRQAPGESRRRGGGEEELELTSD